MINFQLYLSNTSLKYGPFIMINKCVSFDTSALLSNNRKIIPIQKNSSERTDIKINKIN